MQWKLGSSFTSIQDKSYPLMLKILNSRVVLKMKALVLAFSSNNDSYFSLICRLLAEAYLAKSRNFGGDIPKNGTTPKFKFSKFTDFDKQIVYIGVIDTAESKPSLSFRPLLSTT